MNEQKVAQALNTISLGVAELAEALTQPGPVAASLSTGSPPVAAPAGSPVPADLPPSFDELPPEWTPPSEAEYAALVEEIDAIPKRVVRGMGDVCPDHELAWEVVPGGVSKRTGKPYTAFWHCPSFSCKQKPEKEWQADHPAASAA